MNQGRKKFASTRITTRELMESESFRPYLYQGEHDRIAKEK